MNTGTAADSLLIEKFCKVLGAHVFTSTYYTTPVTIASALMVYDMISGKSGTQLHPRPWQEKQIAINFAVNYACISQSTKLRSGAFLPGYIRTGDRDILRSRSRPFSVRAIVRTVEGLQGCDWHQ